MAFAQLATDVITRRFELVRQESQKSSKHILCYNIIYVYFDTY